jgi:hypothetical protein
MIKNGMHRLLLIICLMTAFVSQSRAQITISSGSYVVDMGVNATVKPNGLRPYGMIHELVKYYGVPVIWVVHEGKEKDAIDYSIGGFDYRGGIFIIEKGFITPAVQTVINGWISGTDATPSSATNWYKRGRVTARALTSSYTFVGAKIDTINAAPRWTLDDFYGDVAIGYIANTGIPTAWKDWLNRF